MKTKNYKRPLVKAIVLLIIALSINSQSFGQSPNAINYQGVARDATGAILPLQTINLEYIIHDGTAAGIVVFSETHNVTTTSLGLFNLNIGEGSPVIGTLATVDWGNGAKFIEVVLDGISMGTTQLNSVPYALYAGSSGSGGDFVDLTTNQTIAGTKTFNEDATINGVTIGEGGGSLDSNTAIGFGALTSHTSGINNTATGWGALRNDIDGIGNTANGRAALLGNTSGQNNTAIGRSALFQSQGNNNTAVGSLSIVYLTAGDNNTAIGYGTNVGFNDNSVNNYNTVVGAGAVAIDGLDYATAIGARSRVRTSNSLVLGHVADAVNGWVPIKVGIGTDSPSQTLDVVGKVKITDGTQGAGKVLTSDATGVASWQDANTGGVTTAEINLLIERIVALEARVAALEPEPFSGSVGDFYQGGIVFWIDPQDTSHGLMCAIEDLGQFNYDQAISESQAYVGGGNNDWFLPTIDQMEYMYINRDAINTTALANGGVTFDFYSYRSSTEAEFDSSQAYIKSLFETNGGGNVGAYPKEWAINVRPVRAF